MTVNHHQISIILLSYNDLRVVRAIKSIRLFDDLNTVTILVIDGGSSSETRDVISQNLTSEDILVSEPDRGIFDALNKGLDLCQTKYIGWLGSDDFYTGKVLSSDVVAALKKNDLFVANLHYFHDGYVTRITHSLPAKIGLVKYGLNNPHFATFGRAKLLKSERFDLGLRGADIDYFLKIFAKQPRVVTTRHVATLQEEGGYSNKTQTGIIRTNIELVPLYARYTNWLVGPVLVILKLIFKLLLKIYYKIFRVPLSIND
jgi:glycosyltransferase involved in cell wall biosynthesis